MTDTQLLEFAFSLQRNDLLFFFLCFVFGLEVLSGVDQVVIRKRVGHAVGCMSVNRRTTREKKAIYLQK